GRSTRLRGIHTERIHHLLSDIERNLFYCLDWEDSVADIREQFPLDRSATTQIAEACNILHPRFPGVVTPMVMTTDFVVDAWVDGKLVQTAYSVKSGKDLDHPRTLEKLEIERLYWESKGVEWSIVTPAVLPTHLIRNIEWVHNFFRLDGLVEPHPGFYQDAARRMGAQVSSSAGLPLQQFCQDMEVRLGLREEEGLTLFRHLLATKSVLCDMETVVLSDPLINMASFRTSTRQRQESRA
ncbi:MAG: TnsA endonuclease N-terminal domain-containing protein, partial [Acidithiobacillus sp.]